MSDILNITLHFSFMREHESTPKPKIQDHMPKLKPLIDSIRFSADDVSTKLSFDDLEFILRHLIESTEISFFSREKFNYSLNHSQFAEGTAFYAMTSSVDVNFEKLSNSKHSKLLKPISSSADWEKAKKAARQHTKELTTRVLRQEKRLLKSNSFMIGPWNWQCLLPVSLCSKQRRERQLLPSNLSQLLLPLHQPKKRNTLNSTFQTYFLRSTAPLDMTSLGETFQNVDPSKQTRQHPILT